MLTKDLLRVSRAGGGFHPQFVDGDARPLAARVIDTYQAHVGETQADLQDALDDLEADAEDFKLARGFAALLDREATFETRAAIPPERARRVTFQVAESRGAVTEDERTAALRRAGDRLGVAAEDVETALYADRDTRQVLSDFDPRWDAEGLLTQYNLSLAQTALFDATAVRVRSTDPRAVVTAVKRLGLMYEIHRVEPEPEGPNVRREVVVTGPDALFRRTRRYGTAFARLLRAVAKTPDWTVVATIDDRGTDRTMRLTDEAVRVPGVEPVTEPTYDSGVEADFAARFESLDLDWSLVREPDPLDAGERVMVPDFAFVYDHADFQVYFEIMGFWTPEYVEKKLAQLDAVEGVDLVVAVDESLGVGEEIAARDHRAIPYSGTVRVKDVVDALREYEDDLVATAAASLPDELTPEDDAVTLSDLAADHGVSVEAIEDKSFPEHTRVGRTLVRPDVLDGIRDRLAAGMSLGDAEAVVEAVGIDDVSTVLSELGYRVEWEGLSGGTLREKEP